MELLDVLDLLAVLRHLPKWKENTPRAGGAKLYFGQKEPLFGFKTNVLSCKMRVG